MVKRSSRKRRNTKAPEGSTKAKGDMVEQIVASMHRNPNVSVERNVFLNTVDGTNRTREIDILISTTVVGYPVHIAVECKNEKEPIGVEKIDAFVGKLKDVGIPTSYGVFVSASGYTKGAISRAKDAEIEALILKGIRDKLQDAVHKAFQSVVYLLLSITNIGVRNNIGGTAQTHEVFFFRDKDEKLCGSIPDLVWVEWIKRTIPENLGLHNLNLELPDGWFQIIDGKIADVYEITAEVRISGHVIVIPGSVRHNELINASTEKVTKWEIETSFKLPSGTSPVKSYTSNDELRKFLDENIADVKIVVGNYRLPRIQWMALYWPPSEKAMKKLLQLLVQSESQGIEFDLTKIGMKDIEGSDLSTVWEPIMKDYPPLKLLEEKDET